MSQTISLADIADDMLPWLAAEPSSPLLVQIVRLACIELCAETGIWTLIQDPITVSPNVSTYDLSPEPGATISKLQSVGLAGEPITPRTLAWLAANRPHWQTETGRPKYCAQINTQEIFLTPIPIERVQNGLTITAQLQPARDATEIPTWLYDRYAEELQHGVLSRLMLMPEKPWTDTVNGDDRRAQWRDALGNIRAQAATSFGNAPLRTRSHH